MLGAVVERYPAIKMRATFRDVSYTRKGNAHDAVCYQQRRACPLFLGERQELRRQGAHGVTVECHVGCDPETVENRKQQQRVFGALRPLQLVRSVHAPAPQPPWFPARQGLWRE